MTTRSAEAIHARSGGHESGTFGDWQRYRSTFSEAIGLLAMSEHLPGVTITVQLAVSLEGAASAERSSPGRTREFIMSSDFLVGSAPFS